MLAFCGGGGWSWAEADTQKWFKSFRVQVVVWLFPFHLFTLLTHVVFQPFFWAFTTLEIILHSMRFFAGFVCHPISFSTSSTLNQWFPGCRTTTSIVALALPHLPPPFPSIIINSLKYLQMGSLFLDDLSGIVVGIGFIIYFSGWFGASS
jgi:hypothetical protein